MLFTVQVLEIYQEFVILHPDDAASMGIKWREKAELSVPSGAEKSYATVFIMEKHNRSGYVGLGEKTAEKLHIKTGDKIAVSPRKRPESIDAILKKMNGGKLSAKETNDIILDMTNGVLTEKEIAALP